VEHLSSKKRRCNGQFIKKVIMFLTTSKMAYSGMDFLITCMLPVFKDVKSERLDLNWTASLLSGTFTEGSGSLAMSMELSSRCVVIFRLSFNL
jgi:hypothetical protein